MSAMYDVLSVRSLKGGVGKTSIALYLATRAAVGDSYEDVVFVDLDVLGSCPFYLEDQGSKYLTPYNLLGGRRNKLPGRLWISVREYGDAHYLLVPDRCERRVGAAVGKFWHLGLSLKQKDEWGAYRSEQVAQQEFGVTLDYLLHHYGKTGSKRPLVVFDMGPGLGSETRALDLTVDAAIKRGFEINHQRLLVVGPSHSELARLRRLRQTAVVSAGCKIIVNMLTSEIAERFLRPDRGSGTIITPQASSEITVEHYPSKVEAIADSASGEIKIQPVSDARRAQLKTRTQFVLSKELLSARSAYPPDEMSLAWPDETVFMDWDPDFLVSFNTRVSCVCLRKHVDAQSERYSRIERSELGSALNVPPRRGKGASRLVTHRS